MRSAECPWDTTDSLTRTQELKASFAHVTRQLDDYKILINAMRFGSNQSATMLLAQLSFSVEVEALAESICIDSDAVNGDGIGYD